MVAKPLEIALQILHGSIRILLKKFGAQPDFRPELRTQRVNPRREVLLRVNLLQQVARAGEVNLPKLRVRQQGLNLIQARTVNQGLANPRS